MSVLNTAGVTCFQVGSATIKNGESVGIYAEHLWPISAYHKGKGHN
jgi:hypothetical protein